MVIDSAYKDNFTVFDELKNQPDPSKLAPESTSFTKELFDGCASWWTQGLGHGNPQLAKTAAYAAGRYGHVNNFTPLTCTDLFILGYISGMYS